MLIVENLCLHLCKAWHCLPDYVLLRKIFLMIFLMITYIALFSALLSRLTALACGST